MTGLTGRLVAPLSLATAMMVLTPTGAQAQVQGAEAPPSGSPAVFGGARRQEPGANNVAISANAFGGYDTNILSESNSLGSGGVGGFGDAEGATNW